MTASLRVVRTGNQATVPSHGTLPSRDSAEGLAASIDHQREHGSKVVLANVAAATGSPTSVHCQELMPLSCQPVDVD